MKPEDLIALALRNSATVRQHWRHRHEELVRRWIRDWLGELRYARFMFNRLSPADREEGLDMVRHDLQNKTLELPYVLRPHAPRVLRDPARR